MRAHSSQPNKPAGGVGTTPRGGKTLARGGEESTFSGNVLFATGGGTTGRCLDTRHFSNLLWSLWMIGFCVELCVGTFAIVCAWRSVVVPAGTHPALVSTGWLYGILVVTFLTTLPMMEMEASIYSRLVTLLPSVSVGEYVELTKPRGRRWAAFSTGMRRGSSAAVAASCLGILVIVNRLVLGGANVLVLEEGYNFAAVVARAAPDMLRDGSSAYGGVATTWLASQVIGGKMDVQLGAALAVPYAAAEEYQVSTQGLRYDVQCEYVDGTYGLNNFTVVGGNYGGTVFSVFWGLPGDFESAGICGTADYGFVGSKEASFFGYSIAGGCSPTVHPTFQNGSQCASFAVCAYSTTAVDMKLTVASQNITVFNMQDSLRPKVRGDILLAAVDNDVHRGGVTTGGGPIADSLLSTAVFSQYTEGTMLPYEEQDLGGILANLFHVFASYGSLTASRQEVTGPITEANVEARTTQLRFRASKYLSCVAVGVTLINLVLVMACHWSAKRRCSIVWNGLVSATAWRGAGSLECVLDNNCALQHAKELDAPVRDHLITVGSTGSGAINHVGVCEPGEAPPLQKGVMYGMHPIKVRSMVKALKDRASAECRLVVVGNVKGRELVPGISSHRGEVGVILEGNWSGWLKTADVKCKNQRKQWVCLMAYWHRLMREMGAWPMSTGSKEVAKRAPEEVDELMEDIEYAMENQYADSDESTTRQAYCIRGNVHLSSRRRRLRRRVRQPTEHDGVKRSVATRLQASHDSDFTNSCMDRCEGCAMEEWLESSDTAERPRTESERRARLFRMAAETIARRDPDRYECSERRP